MAFRFNELPVIVQILIYALVALGIWGAGVYLDFSPVKKLHDQQAQLEGDLARLTAEVSRLQAVKQQHQEFLTRLEALEEQLQRLRAFVPEKKATDEFMRTLQGASTGAQVALRSLKSRSVVVRGQIAEMPFDVQLDGGYYDVSGFFDRLGQTSRIINASALTLNGVGSGAGGGRGFDYQAGTTVAGTCTVTTFYTPSEAELAAAAPPSRGGQGQGRR
jgi:type IV pilus assembly protein PilO